MKWRVSLIVMLLATSSAVTAMLLMSRDVTAPDISGVWIESPNDIAPFELTDHNGQRFSRQNLLGRWSLVAYGYTYCPDYCPVILSTLSQVERQLQQQDKYRDLNWLFYSVDHERDDVAQLSKYLSFFDTPYLGLTALEGQAFKNFELGLGIYYQKDLSSEVKHHNHHGYLVNHSLMLLLIDPAGKLKAVLRPKEQRDSSFAFSAEQILADYLAVRRFTDA